MAQQGKWSNCNGKPPFSGNLYSRNAKFSPNWSRYVPLPVNLILTLKENLKSRNTFVRTRVPLERRINWIKQWTWNKYFIISWVGEQVITVTESQIFSQPAEPKSVHKHFIIWPRSFSVFRSSCIPLQNRTLALKAFYGGALSHAALIRRFVFQ